MKLSVFLLAFITLFLPAMVLTGGQDAVTLGWIPAISAVKLFALSLIISAVSLALLAVLLLEAIEKQGRIIIRTDGGGKIQSIGSFDDDRSSAANHRRFGIAADKDGQVRQLGKRKPTFQSGNMDTA